MRSKWLGNYVFQVTIEPLKNYFYRINERNKIDLNKPHDSNMIYYSELNQWFTRNAFRSFSVKYVLENSICYKIHNTEYIVNGGQYLLACKQPDVKAYFDSARLVRSICIDICPQMMSEVFTVLTDKKSPDLDNYLDNHFTHPNFFESINSVQHPGTGTLLRELAHQVMLTNEGRVNDEWFFLLIEQIVHQEYENYLSLNNLRFLKGSTRKEILRRVKIAREYIDLNFLNIDHIREIARLANMSEYHFFRCFRQAFGNSPYQYILSRKLELGKHLLLNGGSKIVQVAADCGFPDIFTFSKAFKRYYKISPSQLLKARA